MNEKDNRCGIIIKGNKNISYICDICNHVFDKKFLLRNHIKGHTISRKLRNAVYECNICEVAYTKLASMRTHIRMTHINYKGKRSYHRDKAVNQTWVEKVSNTNINVEMTKIKNNVILIRRSSDQNEQIEIESNDDLDKEIKSVAKKKKEVKKHMVVCKYCGKMLKGTSIMKHIRKMHRMVKRVTTA